VIEAALASRHRREIEEQANRMLAQQAQANRLAEQQQSLADAMRDQHRSGPRIIVIPTMVAWGSLAAAVLLVALVGYAIWPERTPRAPLAEQPAAPIAPQAQAPTPELPAPAPTVATLTAAQGDQWLAEDGSTRPTVGDRLVPGQRLTLTAGYAQLTTAQGAVALLEAPCTVELTERSNAIRLVSGKLVGEVRTEQAKGFVVTTPQMDVIDVGTRFGMACSAAGTTLRVMEGQVLAAAVEGEGPYLQLVAGQSAVTATDARRVSLINDPADRFVMDWHAIRNQPDLVGDIRYEPSMPGDLRVGGYESNQILLFPEQIGVALTSPVTVNLTQPGLHRDDALQTPTQLAPAKVDSYLIHLDTPAGPSAGGARTAIIRFNRPILAVISNSQAMSQTHRTFGQPQVLYGSMSPGKLGEYSGLDRFDLQPETVELSEDRKTLTLRLSAVEGIDQARILVASELTP